MAIREKTDKDVPVAMYKYAEPTLNFYVGRNIRQLRKEDQVIEWFKCEGERVLIIPRESINALRERTNGILFDELTTKKGINYSKGREVEVVALLTKKQTAQ